MSLDLTLGESQIEPMFSGGAWAGSVIWSAALLLCDWLAAEPASLVEGKVVVELGAGIGVPGMTAAAFGARKVLLTDQSPLADGLGRNVAANTDVLGGEGTVLCAELDWAEPQMPAGFEDGVDLILVSDCVYEGLYGRDAWVQLAHVLSTLCVAGRTVVLNSLERRNVDGVDEFLALCAELGVEHELVKKCTGTEHEDLELYRMFRRSGAK